MGIVGDTEAVDGGGGEEVGGAQLRLDQGEDVKTLPLVVCQLWLAELTKLLIFALKYKVK